MPFGLPTASLRIADLLADPYLFAIPPYQRPYSWTLKEAGQLLEDVIAAAGIEDVETAEADYFLGAMLLLSTGGEQELPEGGESRIYEIVDGQQRLVTLTILACALRDLDESGTEDVVKSVAPLIQTSAARPAGRSSAWRIELRGRQHEFLENCVLVEGACSEMPEPESMGDAERRILEIREHFISELSSLSAEQRLQLAQYIKSACYCVVMMTRDIDRAHRMFVVLNGRGKPLNRHDILKAEILNKAPNAVAGRAVEVWDKVAENLDEDKFEAFFSHLRVIHGHHRPQVIAGVRSIISDVGGAEAFIGEVFEPLARAYKSLLSPPGAQQAGYDGEIGRSLTYLHRLSGTEWVPAAMVAVQRLSSQRDELARQLREVERYAHVLRLLCLGSGKRARRFADVIQALRAGRSLLEAGSPTELNRDDRRTIAFNLRDLHGRNQLLCKLTLLRVNDELSGRLNELDPSALSVEHVLPQRLGSLSLWRSWFPDAQEREACVQSLGNMLLLTPRQNDRARNQEFQRKRDVYAEARSGPVEPLLADVMLAEVWRAEQIKARERRMIELIDRVWRLQISPDGGAPATEGAQRQPSRRAKKKS